MSEENERPPLLAQRAAGNGTGRKNILRELYHRSADNAIVSSDTLTRAAYLAGDLANFYKFHGRKRKARTCYAIENSLLQTALAMEAAHA